MANNIHSNSHLFANRQSHFQPTLTSVKLQAEQTNYMQPASQPMKLSTQNNVNRATQKMFFINSLKEPQITNESSRLTLSGIEEINRGNFVEGLDCFQKGFNCQPGITFIVHLLSEWHAIMIHQNEDAALKEIQRRLTQNPNDLAGLFVKALCFIKPGKYVLAISYLQEFLNSDSQNSLAKFLLQEVERMNGQKRLRIINRSPLQHSYKFKQIWVNEVERLNKRYKSTSEEPTPTPSQIQAKMNLRNILN